MSHQQPTPAERIQLDYTCTLCHAPAGAWCRVHGGTRTQFLHATRLNAAIRDGRLPLPWNGTSS